MGDITTGLAGLWALDEGSGTSTADSSGNSNTGTLVGGASWVAGHIGAGAVSLNGSTGRITVASSASLTVASMTVSAWVYIPTSISGNWETIIEHNRFGSNWYGLWKAGGTTKLHFRWGGGGSTFRDFTASISANTWYHAVGTYDAATDTAKIYLNGTLDTTITTAGAPSAATDLLTIGMSNASAEFFPGTVDDVRVYTRALTAADVTDLYAYTGGGGPPAVYAPPPHILQPNRMRPYQVR